MIDVSFLAKTPKVLPDIHSLKSQINHHPNPRVGVRFSFSFFAHVFCFLISVHIAARNLIVWQVSADDWPDIWLLWYRERRYIFFLLVW